MAESETATPPSASRSQQVKDRALRRFEGSVPQEFWARLKSVGFGEWIILFGAAVLLSVLPMIILFSAMASTRIDDDISAHLGLSSRGAHIIARLFRSSTFRFNVGVLISLLLAIAGTIAVARSVQLLYERAFETTPAKGKDSILRCAVWVLAFSGLLIGDAAISGPLRHDPLGAGLLPLVDLAAYGLFFWWTIHFLLGGKRSWSDTAPAAIATALFWIGLGLFSALYFSSSLVSDSHLYGPIGVVFTLVTWFIAIGAVITLGAVAGVVWTGRRSGFRRRVRPEVAGLEDGAE